MDKKIAVYCRVSTDKDQQLNSLENQKTLFQEKIERDNDILFNIYFDEGLTGTKLNNRKGFNDMLVAAGVDVVETVNVVLLNNGNYDKRVKRRDINYYASDRKPLFDKIYIKNTSRFARTTLSNKIVKKLREKGVSIFFYEQNLDTETNLQDFNLGLFQLLDEQDSRDKSLKVKTGINQSAKKGVIRTNKKIFGYSYDEIDNSLSIIQSEADIIKRIFSLYSSGLGIRRIIKTLDAEGLYTRSGKPFCKTSINRILCNEKYYGGNPALKYETGVVFEKLSYARVKESYDVQISDRIEPIISKELFDKCQQLMKSKVIDSHAQYSGLSKFSSKVICLTCGSVYVSDKDKNKNDVREFFRCSGKKEKGICFCNSKNIRKEQLENKLAYDIERKELERLYNLAIQAISQNLIHTEHIYSNVSVEKVSSLKDEIKDFEKRLEITFETYAEGKLPETVFNSVSQKYNKHLEELSSQLSELIEPEKTFNRRKDELLIRKSQIENKLKRGLTEKDYLDILTVKVSKNGKFRFEYTVPELDSEMSSLFSVIKEKHNL